MKTIQQIAQELNVSKASVYNRLKSNNISLNSLNSKKIKNNKYFDDESEKIIKDLFQDLTNIEEPLDKGNSNNEELDKLREELRAAKLEIERLQKIEEQLHNQISDMVEIQKADKMLLLQQQSNIKMLEAPKPREGLLTRAKKFVFGDNKKESSL